MTAFWVQHGYGKSDKIERLVTDGVVGGVLLSPADEELPAMRATAGSLSVKALLDPQTYVYSIPDGDARCHASHGLEVPGLTWGMAASDVEKVVASVIAANDNLGVDPIISPSCLQRSFGDVWTSLALQMARTTLDIIDGSRDVYVSVVIDEGSLDTWQDVENWLNVVTQLDAHGFYLVVARSSNAPYPAPWVGSRLVNFMRLTYSLSELNGYDVIIGYGDVEGALSVGAGASGSASGWYYSLRSFSESKWQPSAGGRQANPRVFARGLMTPVLAVGEGDAAAGSTIGPDVFPDPGLRTSLAQNAQGWSPTDAWNQHLDEVADLTNAIGNIGTPSQRLDELEARVGTALGRLSTLSGEGVPIATAYRPRLAAMRDGLDGFRAAEGV